MTPPRDLGAWKRGDPGSLVRLGLHELEPGLRLYRRPADDGYGYLTVLVALATRTGTDGPRWHLSISHPTRHPTWEEIKEARFRFMPGDITVAMLLPPEELWINEHEHCFHLWQTDRGGYSVPHFTREDAPS